MQVGIDDLAQYVFVKHNPKYRIDLTVVKGLETSKDLFCFCLDLLCKGLVLLFGAEDNRVVVENLTRDQFDAVNERLRLMGIECKLDVQPIEAPLSIQERVRRLGEIYHMANDLPLADYVLELVSNQAIFKISFNVFHNTGDASCPRA
jgi:hypothetical protein